ncbi:MAG: glycine--tRNA ligase subunit beta [Alphaproteobacteria bacterium]|nr:glycine--tRNA ligase subunit beta [Alphaproteobacteria bacterium]
MSELLVELFSEEVPAGLQEPSIKRFEFMILNNFKEVGLNFTKSEVYWSPMRLTLFVEGLGLKSEDIEINKRGPRFDANSAAINGFANGLKVHTKDLIVEETEKGKFYFYKNLKKGIKSELVIEDAIKNIIVSFPWNKSMRWGSNNLKWIRPLHNILCIFGGKPLKFKIENIESDSLTYGHRYLAPKPLRILNKEDYKKKLLNAKVLVNPQERKDTILALGKKLTKKIGLHFDPSDNLLEEVCNIVEYPFLFIGSFNEEFLSLPEKVLELTMIKQQKYFPLYDKNGSLSKKFLGVSNIPVENNLQIISGNERVLKARLSDARFFFDNDIRKGLDQLSENLKNIIFHRSLGSMEEKVTRITSIISKYSESFNAKSKLSLIAAKFCKADLCSELVYEMPELQGSIGSIYASAIKLPNEVSIAIKEQYSPLGPSDKCPSIAEAAVLSFSDKLDSLVGFIAMDMKATGSKDPFGLRRSCLGIIRILLEKNVRVSIIDVINDSYDSYEKQNIKLKLSKSETQKYTVEFVYDRLRVFLKDQGLSQSAAQAIFGVSKFEDIVDDVSKINALSKFMEDPKGNDFLSILKRVRRILSIEEKKDNILITPKPVEALLEQKEEIVLYKSYVKYSNKTQLLLESEEYIKAMEIFSEIVLELENFFENVKVNIDNEDIRKNRLRLLSMIRSSFLDFADFSLIEAENEGK